MYPPQNSRFWETKCPGCLHRPFFLAGTRSHGTVRGVSIFLFFGRDSTFAEGLENMNRYLTVGRSAALRGVCRFRAHVFFLAKCLYPGLRTGCNLLSYRMSATDPGGSRSARGVYLTYFGRDHAILNIYLTIGHHPNPAHVLNTSCMLPHFFTQYVRYLYTLQMKDHI